MLIASLVCLFSVDENQHQAQQKYQERDHQYDGSGMDPNVIGRSVYGYVSSIRRQGAFKPYIRRIFVRGLTEESHGNAIGIGLADFTTTRLVKGMNHRFTYVNALTAVQPQVAKIPIYFDTDREAIEQGIASLAITDGRPPDAERRGGAQEAAVRVEHEQRHPPPGRLLLRPSPPAVERRRARDPGRRAHRAARGEVLGLRPERAPALALEDLRDGEGRDRSDQRERGRKPPPDADEPPRAHRHQVCGRPSGPARL